MSYKASQLSPASTHGKNLRLFIPNPWSMPVGNLWETNFFRSWLIYDQEFEAPRRKIRDVVLGMALVLVISTSFWVGIGLAIAHVWK
jgi:hypothetical protein